MSHEFPTVSLDITKKNNKKISGCKQTDIPPNTPNVRSAAQPSDIMHEQTFASCSQQCEPCRRVEGVGRGSMVRSANTSNAVSQGLCDRLSLYLFKSDWTNGSA